MSIKDLEWLSTLCDQFTCDPVFRAVFLLAFFAFLRISNITPHAENAFDPSIHLTPQDVLIGEKFMKITLKWSKAIQSRDRVHVVVVPRLTSRKLCPVKAMQEAIAMYNPTPTSPLFQIFVGNKWKILIDSRMRKVL